jgi:hypothetical protein
MNTWTRYSVETWLIGLRHDSFIWDMTRSWVLHDSFIWDINPPYVLQCVAVDCSVLQCVTWLIRGCFMAHPTETSTLPMFCRVLQCIILQCVAVWDMTYSWVLHDSFTWEINPLYVLQCVAACCSVLWCVAVCEMTHRGCFMTHPSGTSTLSACCSVLQLVAVYCSVLQCAPWLIRRCFMTHSPETSSS